MNNTVGFPVSALPVSKDDVTRWVNDEALKVLRQMRTFANMLSWDYQTVSTIGTAAATTIWTSPAMPGDACWTVFVIVSGVSTSDTAQRVGYGRAATFESTSGTVAQVPSTASLWSHESTGAYDVAFSTSASNRTVSLAVTDDGASPTRWTAVIAIGEALPA